MIETFTVGSVELAYERLAGADDTAVPFVFQHGMGGNTAQPLGYVGEHPLVPVVALSARGHPPSDDLTPAAADFDTFADDVIALADHLGLDRFVIGGISLGAGTAINLAARHPDRITGLVLCRPAWLDRPQDEDNRTAYAELADLLDTLVSARGLDPAQVAEAYRNSARYRSVRAICPAAAASLLGQLTRPRAAENSLLLRAFPALAPTPDARLWAGIEVPTLVIGHRGDPFHPYAIAEAYAQAIPGAEFAVVPSKDADADGFALQIRAALHDFLGRTRQRG